jgi:hypothetical protein
MAANERPTCSLSDALISAIDPEILKTNLSGEVLDYIMSLKDVGGADVGAYDILPTPLSLDRTLYEVWWAATVLKLYALKHGRYVMPMPVMRGLKRAWEGLWEVFWGIAAVKFPRNERMTFVRNGMDPCIIATPKGMKGTTSVKVITVGGGPEEEAFAKVIEKTINEAMANTPEPEDD